MLPPGFLKTSIKSCHCFFFCKFSKCLLANAGNILFSVTFKIPQEVGVRSGNRAGQNSRLKCYCRSPTRKLLLFSRSRRLLSKVSQKISLFSSVTFSTRNE